MTYFPDLRRLPDFITIETESECASFSGGYDILLHDVLVHMEQTTDCMKVYLSAQSTPVQRIRMRWNAVLPAETRFCADAWERGYGDFEWRGFVPERVMPWYFYAYTQNIFAGSGVRVRPDAMCFFCCDPAGITLTLDVRCGGTGVILNGRQLICAEIVCAEYCGISPFYAACSFTELLCSDGVFPKAPVYGANNWYYAYGKSSQEEILSDAAYLARLTDGLKNRPYLVIDDGWQKLRSEHSDQYIGGPWRSGNERFPDMAALASKIAAFDILPGIWFRPLQNRDTAIPPKCRLSFDPDCLDPSVPETLAWIAQDVKTLIGWGYRLIKHDFSTFDLLRFWGSAMQSSITNRPDSAFFDRSKTTAIIIKDLYRTIYESAENKAIILGCNCVGHLGAGYMQMNRTGDDVSGLNWERTRRMGVNTLAFRMPQHNRFYFVDADCCGITHSVDWEKNQQWLSLLANSGTPLFVSVKPGTLVPQQEELLKSALARASILQDAAVPLDWLDTTCPANWLIGGQHVAYNWFDQTGIQNLLI